MPAFVAFVVPRLPISCTISMASLFQAPDVSIAVGKNVCAVVMDVYLVVLKVAVWSAAAPTSTAASVNVSETVTSQASAFHRGHGMSVAPSDRFPSVRDSPTGSLATGICARLMALHNTSVSLVYHCCLIIIITIIIIFLVPSAVKIPRVKNKVKNGFWS